MKIDPAFMEKQLTVTTKQGKTVAGLCWGIYGSVQCQEEYGRSESALEIYHDGKSTLIFESEIVQITAA